MSSAKQVETSLLTEHFGWTPISFIDEVINTVNEIVARATDSIESALLSADAGRDLGFSAKAAADNRIFDEDETGEARKEIEEGVLKLETLLEDTVDKNFDKWEIYVLRNVLGLGKEWEGDKVGWLRLSGYENLYIPQASDFPLTTPESLMTLRRKLTETQKLHNLLIAEKARNAAVLSDLRSLLNPSTHPETSPAPKEESSSPSAHPTPSVTTKPDFSFLASTPSTAAGSLTTQTSFPLTQLPLLRKHLEELRPYLAKLPDGAGEPKTETGVRARERTDYVEAQTRRILERRGVDVREGVGGGLGIRRGADEVRGLEEVLEDVGKKLGGEEGEGDAEKMDIA